jgi:Na+(H+)/acetate symporter ActP
MNKGRILFIAVASLILVASFFIPTDEVHFIWERFTLASALFGFIGCLLLIVVTKIFAKRILQRDESYYD